MSAADDILTRLKGLAEKATPAPWTGDRYDGTVKYGIYHDDGNPLGDDRLVLRTDHKNGEYGFIGPRGMHDEPFVIALRNAWPSLLARIEAGERLAEEMERITNPPPAAEFSWARNLARAALAAFAAAKESKHAGGAK